MPKMLYDVPPHSRTRISKITPKATLPLVLLALSSACTPVAESPIVVEQPVVIERVEVPTYSAQAIIPATTPDIRFAQEALNKIGFNVGKADGLWGPRSAKGIRAFEAANSLITANGHLSELNLHNLEIASGLFRKDFSQAKNLNPKSATLIGISAKLDKQTPLSSGPQLIIVDQEYVVLSKPNPYSSKLLTLAPGTGIYVISQQDGYFEIESINRKRGYIKVD